MSKIPLVLAPGFLCDRTVWEPQLPELSKIADVVIIDWGTLDNFDAMSDLVLRSAPGARFALAGHSMGGRVAFEVYRKAPERISHLALMNTNFPPKAPGEAGEAEARGRQQLLDLARAEGMRAMSVQWLKGMLPAYRQTDHVLVEDIIAMFERKTPDDFARQMKALLGRPDATPVLGTIQCPTLVLTGADDAWSGPPAHEKMHAAIAGSTLAIVPECGHMSTMERPQAVTQALMDWLS